MSDHPHDDILSELGPDERERLEPILARLEQLDPSAWEDPGPLPPLVLPPARERRPRWRRPFVLRPIPVAVMAALLLAIGVGVGLLLAGADESAVQGRVVALAPVEPLGGGRDGDRTPLGPEAHERRRLL
jgi:hypothetical protein